MIFVDFDDVIAQANDTLYGLGATRTRWGSSDRDGDLYAGSGRADPSVRSG